MIFLIIFALIIAYVVYIKISVFEKRNNTIEAFKNLDKSLQKRYKAIQQINTALKNLAEQEQFNIEYSEKLMTEAMTLGTENNNIDRRIAYDKELALTMQKIISIIEENQYYQNNTELNAAIDEYNKLDTLIKIAIERYNHDAEILRYAVDKFPSSFIARLSRIKYFDTI